MADLCYRSTRSKRRTEYPPRGGLTNFNRFWMDFKHTHTVNKQALLSEETIRINPRYKLHHCWCVQRDSPWHQHFSRAYKPLRLGTVTMETHSCRQHAASRVGEVRATGRYRDLWDTRHRVWTQCFGEEGEKNIDERNDKKDEWQQGSLLLLFSTQIFHILWIESASWYSLPALDLDVILEVHQHCPALMV